MLHALFLGLTALLNYQPLSAASAAADVKSGAAAQAAVSQEETYSEVEAHDAATAVLDFTLEGQRIMQRLHTHLYTSYPNYQAPINSALGTAINNTMPKVLLSVVSSYLDAPTALLMAIPISLQNEMRTYHEKAMPLIVTMVKKNKERYELIQSLIGGTPPFPLLETEKGRFADGGLGRSATQLEMVTFRCATCRPEPFTLYLFLNGRMKNRRSAAEPRDYHDYTRHDEAFRKQHAHLTTSQNPFGTNMPPQDTDDFKRYLLRYVDHVAQEMRPEIGNVWIQFHTTWAQCNTGWWRIAECFDTPGGPIPRTVYL